MPGSQDRAFAYALHRVEKMAAAYLAQPLLWATCRPAMVCNPTGPSCTPALSVERECSQTEPTKVHHARPVRLTGWWVVFEDTRSVQRQMQLRCRRPAAQPLSISPARGGGAAGGAPRCPCRLTSLSCLPAGEVSAALSRRQGGPQPAAPARWRPSRRRTARRRRPPRRRPALWR